jgi:hypothetical protein
MWDFQVWSREMSWAQLIKLAAECLATAAEVSELNDDEEMTDEWWSLHDIYTRIFLSQWYHEYHFATFADFSISRENDRGKMMICKFTWKLHD